MDLEMPDDYCWEVVRCLEKDAQTGYIPGLVWSNGASETYFVA